MSWLITGSEKYETDPYLSNVSLLLHGDGTNGSTTIVDSSPSPKTVTAVGDAQISTAQSKFGGSSLAFDGVGDYLTAGASTALDFGTGLFTIEFWLYVNSYSAAGNIPLSKQSSASGWQNVDWWVVVNSSAIALYRSSGSGQQALINTSASLPATTWNHIAFVREATGYIYAYVNGAQTPGSTYTGALEPNTTPKPLRIGGFPSWGTMLNGYIDDLRITKGVARYTSNFTPPTAPFPDA